MGPLEHESVDDLITALIRDSATGGLDRLRRRGEGLAEVRTELVETIGPTLAATVLHRFGYRCGLERARHLRPELAGADASSLLASGLDAMLGDEVATLVDEIATGDPTTFRIRGRWLDSFEVGQHGSVRESASEPVCWILTGFTAGFASELCGRDLKCREVRCRGRGDDRCEWILHPAGPGDREVVLDGEITRALRELEGKLQVQQDLLVSVTRDTADAVATVDREGLVSAWSRGAETIFGWKQEDVLGRHYRFLVPEDLRTAGEIEDLDRETRETGRVRNVRTRRLHRDGREIPVLVTRTLLHDTGGRPTGVSAVLKDLTGIHRLQDDIVAAQRKLRAVLDAVSDGIFLATRDRRVIEINPSLLDMLDRAPQDLVGRSCHEVFAGLEEPCENCEQDAVVEAGETYLCQPSRADGRGGERTYDMRTHALRDGTGRVTHLVKHVKDVTEDLRRNRELEQQRRLAAIGELAAKVAHEIKNPLAGISGALQVLSDGVPEEDPRKEVFHDMLEHIHRLDTTVVELLRFARPFVPTLEEVDVQALFDSVLGLVRDDPAFEALTVECLAPGDLGPGRMDAQQMLQVLVNVVQNAAQASSPGGRIELRAVRSSGFLSLTVVDEGVGVPPEARDHVFEPFFTTRHKGTGLGLAICRKIVEGHGGAIRLESGPGSGTTVRIDLPA